MAEKRNGWLARLGHRHCRYLGVDGGSGAHLLAALARRDPRLKPVASPRHADLLVVVEPLSRKLAPAVVESARAMPGPAQVLLVGEPASGRLPGADLIPDEEILPTARRVAHASVEQIVALALERSSWPALAESSEIPLEATTIPLPPKREREIATELAVLSLGPIQPWTAGPLRLLLVCDGEQVLSAQTEAAYARRNVGEAMMKTGWREAAELARRLDPLAPIASQLAYVLALEHLQGWQAPAPVMKLRNAALALERAQNHLWWLARFMETIAAPALGDRAHALAMALDTLTPNLWERPPAEWVVPQASMAADVTSSNREAPTALRRIAGDVDVLGKQFKRDRLIALRTQGIGVLTGDRLKAAGVSGPVLQASEDGPGDVQSRLVTRLRSAARDLAQAADRLTALEPVDEREARWETPAGDVRVAVEGPRGPIGLRLASKGGEGPVRAEWQRPSAALLGLLPEVLAGHKLADAEVVVASLDLAMAEADG